MQVSAPADGGAWEIVVLDGNLWGRGADVLLKHIETGAYLMAREDFDYNANNCGQQCPIAGHLEASFAPTLKHNHRILDAFVRMGMVIPARKPIATAF